MEKDVDALIAQALGDPRRQARSGLPLMHDIDIDRRRSGLAAGLANQRSSRSTPIAKPQAGAGLPPSCCDQAVVTTAGTDRPLRAEAIGDPLENRQVVVVEAAHQARVDREGLAGVAQHLLHALEMRQRLGAQVIDQLRRAENQFLQRRVLAVEDAQRVAVQAPPAVLVEQFAVLLEIAISSARWRASARADPAC
jgi:hypothetical protein